MCLQVARWWFDRRYALDHRRISGLLASRIVDTYESGEISRDGAEKFVRTQYLEMCAFFGMPEAAVNAITNQAVKILDELAPADEVKVYE